MAPKKIVQDILPSKRRTIREATDDEPVKKTPSKSTLSHAERGIRVPILLERVSEEKRPAAPSLSSIKEQKVPPKEPRREKKNKHRRSWKWIVGGVAIVSVVVVGYVASLSLTRASVAINLRSETVPVSGTFSAIQNAASPGLSFVTISTTTVAHVSVAATAGPIVNTYATGWALLINASSPGTQKVVVGTHVEDARGLVYKTLSTVVIPAATSKAPGTVAVKIVAENPGSMYNSLLTSLKGDLSVVAWQGTPKAQIFSGRITTNMVGGASGPKMSVSPANLNSAAVSLSSSLSSQLQNTLQSIVPAGYILYPKATSIAFSSTTVNSISPTTADVSMSAIATGAIFKVNDLENALAKSEIAQFPADNYVVNGLDSLAFAPVAGQTFSGATKSVRFTLSGSLDIDGVVDPAVIKGQLEGKPLSTSNSVFQQYDSVISSAQVSIVPFWIRTIPKSPNKITITVSNSAVK